MNPQLRTLAYGLPRLGPRREYKGLLEGFWGGRLNREAFLQGLDELEKKRLATYRSHVDLFPTGEMSLYDPMLDLAVMTGIHAIDPYDLEAYYAFARGKEALPLRKWFGTNYHYLAPRLPERPSYSPHWNKPLEDFRRYPEGVPLLIGPYTLLRLAQNPPAGEDLKAHLEALGEVYRVFLRQLREEGASWSLLLEPALGLDPAQQEGPQVVRIYRDMLQELPMVLLVPYLALEEEVWNLLVLLPWKGISLDPWRNPGGLAKLDPQTVPVLLVVEGQGVWRTPLEEVAAELAPAIQGREAWLAPRAPLYHLPWRVEAPPPGLEGRLAFAEERLLELALLAQLLDPGSGVRVRGMEDPHGAARAWRAPGQKGNFPPPSGSPKPRPALPVRRQAQRDLGLPPFPTTTIGSFPQTQELRNLRRRLRQGTLAPESYQEAVRSYIAQAIRFQEEVGLDVLVHGEPERSDMVEFFAERLNGFHLNPEGWVLSYGSRVYRPPILAGPVSRKGSLVLEELRYAQSLTAKPVKAILTGPITLAGWSYLPEGATFAQVVLNLAEVLGEEVRDLERAGFRIVQVDEPALLEKMPLKAKERPAYLELVREAFRRTVPVGPQVQVHLHLCYSDYAALKPFLEAMEPDVVSLEAARQEASLLPQLQALGNLGIALGPGVWDVHSPEARTPEELLARLEAYLEYIPPEALWINPDCGLKTRTWQEVRQNLETMVEAAKRLRHKRSPRV